MGGKLSTGISALDRRLDGGLHSGDTLAVVTPPATQSQTILYQLMRERPTVYVTTLRSDESIERDLDIKGSDIQCRVEEVGSGTSMDHELVRELTGSRTYTGNSAVKSDPLDEVYDIIESIDQQCNVVIDPTNRLEHSEEREAYTEVLKKLSDAVQETDSLGVLHCVTMDDPPPLREETLMFADVVWELDVVSTTKNNVEYQLRIPKNRTGKAVLEVLSLEVGRQRVTIDDSRAI